MLNRLVDDLAKESNLPPTVVRAIKLKELSESLGRWVDILIGLKTPRELVNARFQYHHLEIEYINAKEAAKQAANPHNPAPNLSIAD
ncbi:MAG: hypothetical protein JWM04_595 [Verrucomicrobiales bacterium]|nr:hypothetical protein [Verrucomicrobiales bacterium]